MIGGLAMLAASAIVPMKGAETFDLADANRSEIRVTARRNARYLLPTVEEPASPPRARLRVRGRMVKWRVPLGSF